MRGRRRGPSRAFLASFVGVLIILVVGAGVLVYYGNGPTIYHLPTETPSYIAAWARYAPASALQFTFRNYTAVRAINASAFKTGTLLSFLTPPVSLRMSDVEVLASVTFAEPNATVDLVTLAPAAFASIEAQLQSSSLTPVADGAATLYFTQVVGSSQFVSGWLVAIPSASIIGFAEGVAPARTAIDSVLSVRNGTAESLLERTDIRQMFYIPGGPSAHLAFTIENFTGLVTTSQMTLRVVDAVPGQVRSDDVVKFGSLDQATSQYGFVQHEYPSAQSFAIYDQYVLAQSLQSQSDLIAAVQSVG